VVTS